MRSSKPALVIALVAGVSIALVVPMLAWRDVSEDGATPAGADTQGNAPADLEDPSLAGEPATVTAHTRFLAIGGGSTPESTEVSLEQDMALAARTLPGPGVLFFAGGRHARTVRVLDPRLDGNALLARVGDLFAPRQGRRSRYRRTSLPAHAATFEAIDAALGEALAVGSEPLLLYVAAHGEQGEVPGGNLIGLWGQDVLDVTTLAEVTERTRRPVRVVIASCFSGGFGELAFADGNEGKGATGAPRCGLFAGPWDRETSGCDPNPNRASQEGYSMHFLHALKAEDRNGKPLSLDALDYDHDGRIGLLDAHTRARIASRSIDVPTTTSERYLRAVANQGPELDWAIAPEDRAVVEQLGRDLGLHDAVKVRVRLGDVGRELEALENALTEADAVVDGAYGDLAATLLARWPVLDDAYHPDFARTVNDDAEAIRAVLDRSAEAAAYDRATERSEALAERYQELVVTESMLHRLARAYESATLATALHHEGGAHWAAYERLRACERSAP